MKNEHFSPIDTDTYMCVSRSKKCLFFGRFGVLHLFEIRPFALLPTIFSAVMAVFPVSAVKYCPTSK